MRQHLFPRPDGKGGVLNLKVMGLGYHWSVQISPALLRVKSHFFKRFLWGGDFHSHEKWVS